MRAERTARGWTLRDLARLTGVSEGWLSRLENNRVAWTNRDERQLEAVFGLPPGGWRDNTPGSE